MIRLKDGLILHSAAALSLRRSGGLEKSVLV